MLFSTLLVAALPLLAPAEAKAHTARAGGAGRHHALARQAREALVARDPSGAKAHLGFAPVSDNLSGIAGMSKRDAAIQERDPSGAKAHLGFAPHSSNLSGIAGMKRDGQKKIRKRKSTCKRKTTTALAATSTSASASSSSSSAATSTASLGAGLIASKSTSVSSAAAASATVSSTSSKAKASSSSSSSSASSSSSKAATTSSSSSKAATTSSTSTKAATSSSASSKAATTTSTSTKAATSSSASASKTASATSSAASASTTSTSSKVSSLLAFFPTGDGESRWSTVLSWVGYLSFETALKPLTAGKLPSVAYAPDGSYTYIANYPAGTYQYSSSTGHGYSFYSLGAADSLDITAAKEAIFSYSVYFPTGFQFNKGGKLPGLYGGSSLAEAKSCSGGRQDDRDDCFSTRLMWRAEGAGEIYNYLPPEYYTSSYCSTAPYSLCDSTYGESIGRGAFSFATGNWTTVAMRVKLNDYGSTNGEQELYVNGESVISLTGLTISANADTKLYGIMAQTFFGGSDDTWASPIDQSAYFKDWTLIVVE